MTQTINKLFFIRLALVAVSIAGLFAINSSANAASETALLKVPERATEVAPNVFSLGQSYDKDSHALVEGYMIVHKKKGEAKSAAARPGGGSACYGFLSKGAKWKAVEPWRVNPLNPDGLADAFVLGTLSNGIATWEDAADGTLNGSGLNIIGDGAATSDTLVADETATDGNNEVYFAPLENGTIGVTIVWGIFGGPIAGRQLVEWDQVYNTLYPWSGVGEAGKMDFQNIAVHELGHTMGLADLYTLSCGNETMYGYASEGEVNKRDLNAGDIAGMNALY